MPIARKLICLAVGAAVGSGAWGQAPPPGTYQFTSGPGVGTPPFTVSGFSTSLGGSVSGAHLPFCSGVHVHGTFNGFADPMSGGCGHGIIQLLVPPPPVSGGSSLVNPSGSFPGGMPTNVAGQLALTWSGPALDPNGIGDAFLIGVTGFAAQRNVLLSDAFTTRTGLAPLLLIAFMSGEGGDLVKQMQAIGGAINAGAQEDVKVDLAKTLTAPAARVMSAPATTSWLEDFAAHNDSDADAYRRDAERTRRQADEYRKLADDARRQAEENRRRAADARREGREKEAQDWEKEAERDDQRAGERDADGNRLDDRSDEQLRREEQAREQARERRAEAERARERARQIERERAERVKREAEEKARVAREEREARQRAERAEREREIREMEDRVRARQLEDARKRAEARRLEQIEHEKRLAEQQARRAARAQGKLTPKEQAEAEARKKKEDEEKTLADYVVGMFMGNNDTTEEKILNAIKDKLVDAAKEEAMKRTGLDKLKEQVTEQVTDKIDDLGLGKSVDRLTGGIDDFKKVQKIGEWINSEQDKQAGRQQRHDNKIEAILDQRNERVLRGGGSGTIFGRDVIDVMKSGVEVVAP